MTVAADSRAADPREENAPGVGSDEETVRERAHAVRKQRAVFVGTAAATATATAPPGTLPSPEGESRPRERTKRPHAQEKAALASAAAPTEVCYAAMRSTTVVTEDGTPLVVYEPRRERPLWNYALPLAVLGLAVFYAYQNPDLFVRNKQVLVYEHRGAKPDLRYFDALRNSREAPRFTALERINTEDGWLLQMDVPGLTRDEVSIYSMGPILSIRGTHTCPTRRNGRNEPICIERHVFEEIRFPDEADMETARAKLDHGVLKVNVKPLPGYRPRGRVIQIMEVLGEKVHDIGDAVKEKIGFHSATTRSVGQADTNHQDELAWNFDGVQTEEYVRQVVDRFADSLRRALRVPVEKEQQFEMLVRSRTDDLIKQVRKSALTAQQLRDRVQQAAEEVWEEMKQEAVHVGEDIRHMASEAYDLTNRAKDAVKNSASELRDEAAEMSARLSEAAVGVGHKAKVAVREKMEAAKESAQEAVDDMLYNAEYARHRAEEAGMYAAHRAAERLERTQDLVRESSHRAGHIISEKAEKLQDRAKESAHYMRDRAAEKAERAQDRASEESNYIRHLSEEAAQQAEHRVREAAHHPKAAGRQTVFESKEKPKSVVDTLKEKFGWGSAP